MAPFPFSLILLLQFYNATKPWQRPKEQQKMGLTVHWTSLESICDRVKCDLFTFLDMLHNCVNIHK